MEDVKVQVCRLCFNLISDKNFFALMNSLKEMIEVITTDLNLDKTSDPVICRRCFKLVQNMFTFKTNFFENEECIESKTSTQNNVKLDIKDIMAKRPTRMKGLIQYCRICLKVICSEKFFDLNSEVNTKFSTVQSCIPEMDLQLTKNPVMCQFCHNTLQKIENFKSLCRSNESKINIFSRVKGTDTSKKINLHEVLYFQKNRSIHDCKIKIENHTDGNVPNESQTHLYRCSNFDTELEANKDSNENHERIVDCLQCVLVKMESSDDEDVPEIRSNLTRKRQVNRLQSHTQRTSWKKVNKNEGKSVICCSECNYKNKNKHRLRHHLVIAHKRKDIEVNKKFYQCVHCNFCTKWYIDLTRHLLSHAKPEVLKCTKCPFSTNQNSQLIKHILSHISADNIDKYKFLQLTKKVN